MNTRLKKLAIVALGILSFTWPTINVTSTAEDDHEAKESPDARAAYLRRQLQDENGQIPPNARLNALQQKARMEFLPEAWSEFSQSKAPNTSGWTSIGPGNLGGRIRSIIVHPSNPSTIWLGAVDGGIWKTTNGGNSWSTNTDSLANLAVNCMAMQPTNPNVLYAGTGEGFFNYDNVQGSGIFKTENGGNTWTQLSSTIPQPGNDDFAWVNRLAISPTNAKIVLAATRSGKILRSTSLGETWSTTFTGPAMCDVRFRPNPGAFEAPRVGNPNCVAGALNGSVYYSHDSGGTWTAATGLPVSGRVELAYSRSNPANVYALEAGNLYRSQNYGISFQLVGGPGDPDFMVTGGYCMTLWVDPINPNIILAGSNRLYRTTDGGVNWAKQSIAHPDHHVIIEDPGYNGTSNTTVYDGNDGGIYQTTNLSASVPTWTSRNHNLAITQFYGAAGNVATGKIIGGAQDLGTSRYSPEGGPESWTQPYAGGDGGFCAADQTDSNYFYGSLPFLRIYRSTNGAGSFFDISSGITDTCGSDCRASFVAPFILDPMNPNTLLAGGRSLWRSTNVKDPSPTWSTIKPPANPSCNEGCNVSAIAVRPGNSNVIWVGQNDASVYRTENANVDPPTWTLIDTGLPDGRRCSRIALPAPAKTGVIAYVTFDGYNTNNIWRTSNNGASWTNIHHNIPATPVYSLVISPSNPTTLYVGTEIGVFASVDSGATWSPQAPDPRGPANVRVDELFWMGNTLVAATHGRGMFTIGP